MRNATRYFILIYGAFETFIFTGNIFGWTALHYMLRQEGIFEYVCEDANAAEKLSTVGGKVSGILMTAALGDVEGEVEDARNYGNASVFTSFRFQNESSARVTCDAQDRLLNLAYTVGSFCIGFSSFIWGFLLERWGLRCVRLIINALITCGTVLLSLTVKETSFLLFPSLILMCLAGVPLRLANMQIADLFPRQRSTIITTYSGAFTASASVFVFIKYGFDAGLPWEWACFLLVCLSVLMLPVTLFLLPADRIREPRADSRSSLFALSPNEVTAIAPSVWGTYTFTQGSPPVKKKAEATIVAKSKAEESSESSEPVVEREIPLRESLLSFSFVMHQYWFCWLLLYTIIYVGTLHLWSKRTSDDLRDAATFSETYGLFQVTGLFLAPIGGIFMDRSIRGASQEVDLEVRGLRVLRSCFWPMFLTTATEAVAQACKFFDLKIAVYVSIVAVTLLRAFFISIGTAYLRIRFPGYHFNKLLGIMSTMSAIFSLMQFPLFLWESSSPQSVLHVNIFDSVCLAVAFIHPLLLLVTPLQKHFFRKEKQIADKYAT